MRGKAGKKGTPDKGNVQKAGTFGELIWCSQNEARNVGRNKTLKGLKHHDQGFEHYSEGMSNQ